MAKRRWVQVVTTGVAAAAVTGLVSAIITRILMRVIALMVNTDSHFSLEGSSGIALIYIALLLPGCLALAYTRTRWPWILFGAGVAVLMFEAVAIGLQETAAANDMTVVRWFGLVLVLMLTVAVYCAHVILAARLARRRSSKDLPADAPMTDQQ